MQPIFNCSLTTGLYCLFLSQVWFLGLGYQYLFVCNRMQTSGQLHWAAISLCCSHRTNRCSVYTRKMEGYRGTSVVIAIINLLWKTYEGELPPSDNTSWCCWMGLNFGLFSVFFFSPVCAGDARMFPPRTPGHFPLPWFRAAHISSGKNIQGWGMLTQPQALSMMTFLKITKPNHKHSGQSLLNDKDLPE